MELLMTYQTRSKALHPATSLAAVLTLTLVAAEVRAAGLDWTFPSGSWQVEGGALVGDGTVEAAVAESAGNWQSFVLKFVARFRSEAPKGRFSVSFGESSRALVNVHAVTFEPRADELRVEYVATGHGGRTMRGRGRWVPLAKEQDVQVELLVGGGRLQLRLDGELAVNSAFAADVSPSGLALKVSKARVGFHALDVQPLSREVLGELAVGKRPNHRFVVIAHRGASAQAPENTLAALRLAAERGAQACEFDVHATLDGEVVLMHDKTVGRTTDFAQVFKSEKEGHVDKLTLAQLRQLDAGQWKGKEYRGERVPTLAEALEFLRGKMTPIVEIKPGGIGIEVAKAIKEANMEAEVFVQSFSPQAIRDVRSELPGVPTGLLIGADDEVDPVARARGHVERARAAGASAVVCHFSNVSPEYLESVQRRAMAVWVYTVDDAAIVAMLRDMGIDGIITNVPRRTLDVRSRPSEDSVAVTGGLGVPPDGGGEDPVLAEVDEDIDLDGTDLEGAFGSVTIDDGEVEVVELARFYSEAVDLPLVVEASDAELTSTVTVAAAIRDADPSVVQELLAQNGFDLEERRLASGLQLVMLRGSSARAAGRRLVPEPIVSVGTASGTSHEREGPSEGRSAQVGTASEAGEGLAYGGFHVVEIPPILLAQTRLERRMGVVVRKHKERAFAPGSLGDVVRDYDVVTRVGRRSIRSPADFVRRVEEKRGSYQIELLRKGRSYILGVRP